MLKALLPFKIPMLLESTTNPLGRVSFEKRLRGIKVSASGGRISAKGSQFKFSVASIRDSSRKALQHPIALKCAPPYHPFMGELENQTRLERDSMGEMSVPADVMYGASTARAVENFPISNLRFPREFI
ncbi:MAG: hypothetical protein ACXW32_10775, partial [Limisphaerales bacterium]